MLWPGGLLFRYAPFEQLPGVVAAIPMYISGWREIVHVIGYSIVCISLMTHVRQLLPPLLLLNFCCDALLMHTCSLFTSACLFSYTGTFALWSRSVL